MMRHERSRVLATGAPDVRFARVTVDGTLPFAPALEERALPGVAQIARAATTLLGVTG